MFPVETISDARCLIEKNMVRESTSKMHNGITAALSDLVSDMLKSSREARIDKIKNLVNQIMEEGFIPNVNL